MHPQLTLSLDEAQPTNPPEWHSPNRRFHTPEAHERQKQRLRDWYQRNKQKLKEKRKAYRDSHKEQQREWKKQYLADPKNKDKARDYHRQRYLRLRPEYLARCAEYRANNKEKVRLSIRRWNQANRERANQARRAWRAANPEKVAAINKRCDERNPRRWDPYKLKYTYGLTYAQLDAMRAAQNNACAVCGRDDQKLVIDHSRSAGRGTCRGLLCNRCNLAIGQFADSIEIMANAIEYLKRTGSKGGDLK